MCDQLTDSFGFLWLHAHFISRVDPPMENGANVGWLQLQIYFIHHHHSHCDEFRNYFRSKGVGEGFQ